MNKLLFLILLLCLSSCAWTVYKFERSTRSNRDDIYVLHKNKDKYELYILGGVEAAYYMNLDLGYSMHEIENELGQRPVRPNVIKVITISKQDSGFTYTYKNRLDSLITDFQYSDKKDCFISSTFIWDWYDGTGIANNTLRPWWNYYTKFISDTTYYFKTELPCQAYNMEYAPFNLKTANDSCHYSDPIPVIIEKSTGLPLSVHYLDVTWDGEEIIESWIWCTDKKKIRMPKKKLLKVLF